MNLTEKQKVALRRQGHALKVLVQTGNQGLTPAVLNQIKEGIDYHELIKVRVLADDRDAKKEMIKTIVAEIGATLVQNIGHVILLYKHNPERNRITLV